ncbi:MAG: cytochrome c [Nitratireductor sp.]|nr:cytochrome c [Nitratireductor sp.]MCB1438939.1 cytochrome c [Nitratireductor sp.]MCC0021184.1 cytochrome c [Nitratireductor sp.]
MKRPVTFAALILVAASFSAFAHMGATGIVKQRMETMKEMKSAMAEIGAMVKKERPFDASVVAKAGKSLARDASRISGQFPNTKESRQKVSEATERVWEEMPRFKALAVDLEKKAKALSKADSAASMKVSFMEVGKACSACHEDFRRKRN